MRERFHGDDGVVEIRRANVHRVRDEIAEIWIFEGDQYEGRRAPGGPAGSG